MATPIPKSAQPDTVVVLPRRMFLQALDYNPHARPRTKPTADQAKVSEARLVDLAGLHRMAEGLTTGVKHLRFADNAGHFNASVTVLQVAAADFLDAVSKLSKSGANAAARYEETAATPPPVQPVDGASPAPSIGPSLIAVAGTKGTTTTPLGVSIHQLGSADAIARRLMKLQVQGLGQGLV